MLQVQTRHFGTLSIDESEVIRFEQGILGFEDVHEYVLLGDREQTPFFWIQSVDGSDVSMIVADPFSLYPDYAVDLDDPEVASLEIGNPDKVLSLSVVIIPKDIRQMRANLKAPLIINLENNKGMQVVQYNDDLPLQFFLLQEA